jgi:hypothetical protein
MGGSDQRMVIPVVRVSSHWTASVPDWALGNQAMLELRTLCCTPELSVPPLLADPTCFTG